MVCDPSAVVYRVVVAFNAAMVVRAENEGAGTAVGGGARAVAVTTAASAVGAVGVVVVVVVVVVVEVVVVVVVVEVLIADGLVLVAVLLVTPVVVVQRESFKNINLSLPTHALVPPLPKKACPAWSSPGSYV